MSIRLRGDGQSESVLVRVFGEGELEVTSGGADELAARYR